MSKYQIQYGPNASLDGHDVDLASADRLIESLRQQLSGSQKREVMLRLALETCQVGDFSTGHVIYPSFDEKLVNEALVATADLKGVILCDAEPVGWCGTSGVGEFMVSKSKVWNFLTIPLYRAWEPTK